jgi:hypothetical protein
LWVEGFFVLKVFPYLLQVVSFMLSASKFLQCAIVVSFWLYKECMLWHGRVSVISKPGVCVSVCMCMCGGIWGYNRIHRWLLSCAKEHKCNHQASSGIRTQADPSCRWAVNFFLSPPHRPTLSQLNLIRQLVYSVYYFLLPSVNDSPVALYT